MSMHAWMHERALSLSAHSSQQDVCLRAPVSPELCHTTSVATPCDMTRPAPCVAVLHAGPFTARSSNPIQSSKTAWACAAPCIACSLHRRVRLDPKDFQFVELKGETRIKEPGWARWTLWTATSWQAMLRMMHACMHASWSWAKSTKNGAGRHQLGCQGDMTWLHGV